MVRIYRYSQRSIRFVVADRIIDQVVGNLIDQLRRTLDRGGLNMFFQVNTVFRKAGRQRLQSLIGRLRKIHLFFPRIFQLIELRKSQNIIDQLQHPGRFLMNPLQEHRNILFLDHPVFQ